MRADQEPEDEPEEAEDAEDEDEEATQQLELKSNATEVHLKLAPGHKGSMTIVAKSTEKDNVADLPDHRDFLPRLQLESKRNGAACAQQHIETNLQSFDDSCRHIASFARGQGTGKKRS